MALLIFHNSFKDYNDNALACFEERSLHERPGDHIQMSPNVHRKTSSCSSNNRISRLSSIGKLYTVSCCMTGPVV